MITLRLVRPEDAEQILEIYRPYVEKTSITFETQVPEPAEFKGRIAEIAEMFPYVVAEEHGEIVGYAYAHPFRERAAYNWTVETSIYLREDRRGRKLGNRLYTALLALLQAQGVCNACAVVTVPNERSVRFHQNMGFAYLCTMPQCGFKAGAWHGTAYLYRQLSQEDMAPKPLIPIGNLDSEFVQNILNHS